MGDRVLNFSEFSGKFSSADEKDLTDVAAASDNFKEGFDEETYDSPEIKPNRPVADGESAIPQPDEDGAPSFTADVDSEMVAPGEEAEGTAEVEAEEEEVETAEEPVEPVETEEESEVETEEEEEEAATPAPVVDYDEDGGNPEDEDEDEDESDDEEEEEEDEEETNESVKGLLKGFDSYIKG